MNAAFIVDLATFGSIVLTTDAVAIPDGWNPQAAVLYNEYINDKEHLHMNATKWETLTDFVKDLGRNGKCFVDETPKGWFITYIDRDPEVSNEA